MPALPSRQELAWSQNDVGLPIVYAGFGRTETGRSGSRLKVDSAVHTVCQSAMGCSNAQEHRYIPNNTVCSVMASGGTCSGDSGGPLFLTRNGVTYVGGATSFGDESCTDFGCSTSISAFAGWIAEQLGSAVRLLPRGTGRF